MSGHVWLTKEMPETITQSPCPLLFSSSPIKAHLHINTSKQISTSKLYICLLIGYGHIGILYDPQMYYVQIDLFIFSVLPKKIIPALPFSRSGNTNRLSQKLDKELQFDSWTLILVIMLYCLLFWFYPESFSFSPHIQLLKLSWFCLLNVSWLLSCPLPPLDSRHLHLSLGL